MQTLCSSQQTGRAQAVSVTLKNGTVDLTIFELSIPALVDTGASVSCISDSFATSLIKKHKLKTNRVHQRVFTADGSGHTVRKTIKIPLQISSMSFNHKFLILPKLHRTIILGCDFLKDKRASINFNNAWCDMLTIRTPTNITIPPMTEHTMIANINAHISLKTIGITENLQRKVPVPYVIKRALVQPEGPSNEIPITVFNTSTHRYKLHKDSILALFCERKPHDFLYPRDTVQTTKQHDSKFDVNPQLTDTQKTELQNILEQYKDTFVGKDKTLGLTTQFEHRIDLKRNYAPVNIMPYRTSPQRMEIMHNMLLEQEKQGVIERCRGHTEWASPAFLVEKPRDDNNNRQYRMVVDFRHLNSQIKDQARTFPRADDTIYSIGQLKGKYFTKMDAYSGFFQIPLRSKDRHLTAFTTPGNKWQYKVMPMGLKTSPKAFHNVIASAVASVKSCLPYVDDLVIASTTWDNHLFDLTNIFKAFRKANIKFKASKCSFGHTSIPFLGFVVSSDGIRPDPKKSEIIANYPIPKNVKEMKSFNGLANYYRAFIPNYSHLMAPLYLLTKSKHKFQWNDESNDAFEIIKKSITDDVMLHHPDPTKLFTISSDASKFAIGACISQKDKYAQLRPVAFAGRKLNPAEINYSTTDRELLAIKFALEKFEHFIIGRRFIILTDHAALTALNSKTNLQGRMARWLDTFTRFDYEIIHIKGKLNTIPDTLSRTPLWAEVGDNLPHFNNQNKRRVTFNSISFLKTYLSSDYLESNPITVFKPRGILTKKDYVEAVTRSKANTVKANPLIHSTMTHSPHTKTEKDDSTTSKVRKEKGPTHKEFRLGKKASATRRKKLLSIVKDIRLSDQYVDVFQHIPPTMNRKTLITRQNDDTFCQAMIEYIMSNSLPKDNILARKVLLSHDHFFVHQNILFRFGGTINQLRSNDILPQIVVPQEWTQYILTQLHTSPLGAHFGVDKLMSILTPRFYWDTMVRDVHVFVSTCHVCISSKNIKNPLRLPMTLRDPAPGPFVCMTIDSIGPIHMTSAGNKYIQVVVDFYSRYVFAWSAKNITAKTVAKELFNNVICHVGVPTYLYSDNGPAFAGTDFKRFCKQFGITQIFGSCYKPTTQGLVERANQTIIQSLRAYVSRFQTNWDEFLSAVVFAYNISDTYSLGYSPFLLIHGRHATIPAQSALTDMDPDLKPVQNWLLLIIKNQDRFNSLARKNLLQSHIKMKRRHDKTSRNSPFHKGQLVYVKNPALIVKGTSKKLQPLFSGPFLIIELPSKFTAKLRRLSDGKTMHKNVHVERLRLITQVKGKQTIH